MTNHQIFTDVGNFDLVVRWAKQTIAESTTVLILLASPIARRRSQVVRQGSAKPLYPSSNLGAASNRLAILNRIIFIFSLVCHPLVTRAPKKYDLGIKLFGYFKGTKWQLFESVPELGKHS